MRLLKAFPGTSRRLLAAGVSVAALIAGGIVPAAGAHGAGTSASPQSGGSLTFNLGVVLDCADAAKSGELASVYVFSAMTDTLVSQDAAGRFVADLATSWSFSHGGTWLTFQLRHGVRFSNGNPVDAQAIRFNLMRPENRPVLGTLKSVTVDGPNQLTIILSAPYRPILSNLAFLVPIYDPKSISANDCRSVIGSGPFKIANVGPGFSTITFARNPYHTWNVPYGRNKGSAYLSTLTFDSVSDPATAVSELLSGSLDIAGVAGTQLNRIAGNASLTAYRQLQQNITWLGFNTAHPPFNNPAVRRAIAEAIDRTAVIAAALNGQGVPAYSMVPSTVPFYDPAAKSYAPPYDPTAAKSVLAANHVTGPYTLLGFTGFYATISEVIQAELTQVGVQVNVVSKPLADFFPAAAKGAFDLSVQSYSGPDPDTLFVNFHSSQETATGSNYTFYKSSQLDNLLVAGQDTEDQTAAATAYDAAQKLIVGTQTLADPLYVPYGTVAVSSRVGGFHRNVWALMPVWQDLYVAK